MQISGFQNAMLWYISQTNTNRHEGPVLYLTLTDANANAMVMLYPGLDTTRPDVLDTLKVRVV